MTNEPAPTMADLENAREAMRVAGVLCAMVASRIRHTVLVPVVGVAVAQEVIATRLLRDPLAPLLAREGGES